jgi:putative ABC transport system substrate-binding protein
MQPDQLKRREFITSLGCAAVFPLGARAQSAMPVIGFLSSATSDAFKPYMGAFHRGLAQIGFHENQNVHIEYRFANGNFDLLPALASDLVQAKVAVIFTSGGSVAAFAAQKASGVIPIVFALGRSCCRWARIKFQPTWREANRSHQLCRCP